MRIESVIIRAGRVSRRDKASHGAGREQLKTDVRNVRSQQAIARLGARYEGTVRRYQRRADGSVRHADGGDHHARPGH